MAEKSLEQIKQEQINLHAIYKADLEKLKVQREELDREISLKQTQ